MRNEAGRHWVRRRLVTAVVATAALGLLAPAGASALGAISGTATAENGGAAVPNFEIELYEVESAAAAMVTCTEADGTYAIPIEAGTYEARFSGDAGPCGAQSAFAPEWYDSHFARSLADPVVVAEGVTTPNINASLQDGGRIDGTVTDSTSDDPIENVTVQLLDVSATSILTSCTGTDGTYALDPVPPGIYSVKFTANGSCGNAGGYLPQWYENSPTAAGASPIGIVAGQELGPVDGSLVPGVPATLTVSTAGTGAGSVGSDTGGISCPGVCAATVPHGSTVTLTATPAPGSTFAGWSGGGCSGVGTCVVTMNADQAATATFAAATTPPGSTPPGSTPPGASAPETKIDKAKIKAKKGKAKFTFSGSGGTAPLGFECALVKKNATAKFTSCGSSKAYKRLKKGKYTFEVRASDASGKVDGSPAKAAFKSKLRKG